jgi:hypothetical protein
LNFYKGNNFTSDSAPEMDLIVVVVAFEELDCNFEVEARC